MRELGIIYHSKNISSRDGNAMGDMTVIFSYLKACHEKKWDLLLRGSKDRIGTNDLKVTGGSSGPI